VIGAKARRHICNLPGLVETKSPEHLHRRQSHTLGLELRDSLEGTGGSIIILTAQEVQVKDATDSAESNGRVSH